MKRVMHTFVVVMLAALAVVSLAGPVVASSDSTIVTIDPTMPDDFLNLYPELDGEEAANLPATGVSATDFVSIGLITFGITAVALAAAAIMRRPRHDEVID